MSSGERSDDLLLPEWFWKTPAKLDAQFAVGYAEYYSRNIEASYREAFKDATWRLYRDSGCRIRGERAFGTGPDGVFSLGEQIRFEIDSSSANRFFNSITHIDSFKCKEMVTVLVGTRDISVANGLSSSPSLRKAANIKPIESSVIGTGICRSYRSKGISWQEAEFKARVEAAFSIDSKVEHLRKNIDNRMTDVTVNKTDVVINSCQTVRRAYDKKAEQMWVYVIVE